MGFSTPVPILVFLVKTCEFNKTAFPKEVSFPQRKSSCCQILCFNVFRGKFFYLFARNTLSFWNVTLFIEEKKIKDWFVQDSCAMTIVNIWTYTRKKKDIFNNLLSKQEKTVLEQRRSRVWRALAVFDPSLWELLRSPKATAQFHLEQLLAQPGAPGALLAHDGAAGDWERHIHTATDTPGTAHSLSHRAADPTAQLPPTTLWEKKTPVAALGLNGNLPSQDGAGCGQQSCRTFNICTPRQFKQAFEPTYLLIIV